MNQFSRQLKFGAVALCIFIAGCSFGGSGNRDDETSIDVKGAMQGVMSIFTAGGRPTMNFVRAGSSLGVFATVFFAEEGVIPTFSAIKGVNAQMMLHSTKDLTEDDTFALLQEFGSVLSVDVPDLLNRSTDRTDTLNDYVTGLTNITARATERMAEIETKLDTLESERRTANSEVSTIQRTVNDALRDKDYGTAASEQEKLAEAKNRLSKVQVEQDLTEDIAGTFEDLLELAVLRLEAIDKNRQVIISGLTVVEIPGIEDLNILENPSRRGGGGGFGF